MQPSVRSAEQVTHRAGRRAVMAAEASPRRAQAAPTYVGWLELERKVAARYGWAYGATSPASWLPSWGLTFLLRGQGRVPTADGRAAVEVTARSGAAGWMWKVCSGLS